MSDSNASIGASRNIDREFIKDFQNIMRQLRDPWERVFWWDEVFETLSQAIFLGVEEFRVYNRYVHWEVLADIYQLSIIYSTLQEGMFAGGLSFYAYKSDRAFLDWGQQDASGAIEVFQLLENDKTEGRVWLLSCVYSFQHSGSYGSRL